MNLTYAYIFLGFAIVLEITGTSFVKDTEGFTRWIPSIICLGTIMYLIEGDENGFTSIPRSIYWAIVTITTVGYGDISPQTELGQVLASLAMIMGYATIAVPTGIISAEYSTISKKFNSLVCISERLYL